jgi:EAL domain-containing protein (putative c-di-GMP-specific phosphodiesterase class I)
MSARSWLLGAFVFLCVCIAIGSSFFLIASGKVSAAILGTMGLASAAGIAGTLLQVFLGTNDVRRVRHAVKADISALDRRLRDDRGRNETLTLELAELRDLSNRNSHAISKGFSELKDGYAVLNEQLRTTISTVSNFNSARSFAAQHSFARPVSSMGLGVQDNRPSYSNVETSDRHEAAAGPRDQAGLLAGSMSYSAFAPEKSVAQAASAPTDQLMISLEPIVDLFTSKTVHYRLHLAMAQPDGSEIEQDVLLHHADRAGLRCEFDLHAAREALQLLRRLRQRDSDLSIFMGIGPSTLQSHSAVERMLALAASHADVSGGLVLEMPHAMLAGLSDAGLEGLARLARSGVVLSLSNVAVNGIDLAPLATLNVRYLALSSLAAGGAEGPGGALISFAQAARVARINTIVTGVIDRRVIPKLTKLTRLACGPVFAEPRRVKAGATQDAAPVQHSVGAAA